MTGAVMTGPAAPVAVLAATDAAAGAAGRRRAR